MGKINIQLFAEDTSLEDRIAALENKINNASIIDYDHNYINKWLERLQSFDLIFDTNNQIKSTNHGKNICINSNGEIEATSKTVMTDGKNIFSNLPVGSIFCSVFDDLDEDNENFLLLDGTGYLFEEEDGEYCGRIYDFYNNFLINKYSDSDWFEYNTRYSASTGRDGTPTGRFRKIWNSNTNPTKVIGIKTPDLCGMFLQGSNPGEELGIYKEPELPNIQGKFDTDSSEALQGKPEIWNANGAFGTYKTRENDTLFYPVSNVQMQSNHPRGVSFSAARSNAIYKDNATVQPPAITVYYYMVIGTTQIENKNIYDVVKVIEDVNTLNKKINKGFKTKNFDGDTELKFTDIDLPKEESFEEEIKSNGNPIFITICGNMNPEKNSDVEDMDTGPFLIIKLYKKENSEYKELNSTCVQSHTNEENISFSLQYLDTEVQGIESYKVKFEWHNWEKGFINLYQHGTPTWIMYEV